jgi:hypothetical protein
VFAPLRLLRIVTTIPLWNLKNIFQLSLNIIILRRGFTSPGRERLRRFRPDLELPEPGAPDGRAPARRSPRWRGAFTWAFRRVTGAVSAVASRAGIEAL